MDIPQETNEIMDGLNSYEICLNDKRWVMYCFDYTIKLCIKKNTIILIKYFVIYLDILRTSSL